MEDIILNINPLLNALIKGYANPIIALNSENSVINYNNFAAEQLKIDCTGCNLNDLFSEDTNQKLTELIQTVIRNQSFISYEDFTLHLKDSTVIITHLNFNYINLERDFIVLISFPDQDSESAILNFTKFDIRSGNPISSFENPQLAKVLKEIKYNYPFTVTTKERLRKIINDFGESISIKNKSGKFILVNQSYAQNLGVSASHLEGRDETDFIPIFVKDLLLSIHKYLFETHNYIIIEGIPFQGNSDPSEQQTVEIPISDFQNNVIAFVSITQNKIFNKEKSISAEIYLTGEIIEIFPKPVAYVDKAGHFQHVSFGFCKLVNEESEVLNNLHISQVLPSELTEIIKAFQNSNVSAKELFATNEFVPCNQEEATFKIFIKKVSINNFNDYGVFLFIDDVNSQVDLSQILNQRGKMFDILIQKNPEPIFIYDIDNLRFLEVNSAALEFYGYSRDEFLQMDLTDLYTPEDIQTLLGTTSNDDAINNFEGPFRHKKKNGESVFVEISKTKFNFNNKECFFNIIKNVSAQLELAKTDQLFRATYENTSETILITDANGFIKFINEAGSDLLGYSSKEIQNTSFTALVKDDERAMINTSVFSQENNDTIPLLLDIKKADGTFLSSEISFTPVFNYANEIDSFIILLKAKSTKTPEVNEEIKEVIKEVIIEKDNSTKSVLPNPNFLSGVFHEILTPMNVILGFAQELTDSIENPTAEQKEATDLINQNKIKLLGTMNSVVEFSELLQKKSEIKYSEVSITQMIDIIDKKIPELINLPDTQFSYGKISSSLTFITDFQKFETLISSIIKIVGRIIKEKKIYLSAFPYNDDHFVVLICDNYNNCSDYLLSKLQFIFTGDNDLRELGVPKLTTHLSKMLLPVLRGSFTLDENFGGGFLFPLDASKSSSINIFKSADEKIEEFLDKEEVHHNIKPTEISSEEELSIEEEVSDDVHESKTLKDLEIEEAADDSVVEEAILEPEIEKVEDIVEPHTSENVDESEIPTKPGGKLELSNLSCLYIEDQVDSQILFKVQMKGLKEIKFAVSFEEALPMLESRTFDFIVMDINLQGEYNGLDALRIINKMPSHESTPVIAVTAYVLPGDREKFIATGFNDFVSKPIFREKMIESLERVFS